MNKIKNYEVKEIKKVTIGVIWMCFLGAQFYCYEYYLRVAPSVMQLDLMKTFHVSNTGLGVLTAYYYYAYVPLQIPVGLMMDKWGPRLILTIACMLCAIGTFIFTGTNIVWIAKTGRFIVGFGSAFAYVGVLKIASLWLPTRYFAVTVGLATTLGMIGAMIGEIIMVKIILYIGWRYTLYYASFVGIILTIVIWFSIKNDNKNDNKYDTKKNNKDISILFQLLKLLKLKQIWLIGAIGCFAFLPLTVLGEMWAVPFLEKSGLIKTNAAFGSGMLFFGFACGGPLWGIISEKVGSRKYPMLVGSLLASLASAVIIYIMPEKLYVLYIFLFMCGLCSSVQVLVFVVGNDICDQSFTATTVALINSMVMCGGVFLQPLVGIILDITSVKFSSENVITAVNTVNTLNAGNVINSGGHTFGDYQIALTILPVSLILSAICAFFLKESYSSLK